MKLTVDFIILQLANSCLMVYTFLLFFSSFANKRFSNKQHRFLSFFIILAFAVILLFVDNKIATVILLISLVVLTSFLFLLRWYNALLLSFLGYVFGALAEIITALIFSLLFNINIQMATKGHFYVLGILLSKFITLLTVVFIRIKKQKNLYVGSFKKLLAVILIPCSTIVIMLLQYYYFMIIPTSYKMSILPALLCYIFLIFSNALVLNLIEHLYQDIEKENQLKFAMKVIDYQKVQYNQLLEHNKSIHRIRHDYKNALIGLVSEIEQKNYTQALTDLRDQLNKLQLPYNSSYSTGVIGTILNAKTEIASRNGIEIDFSHSELSSIKISEMDLAIILGNALDNAIEATQTLSEKSNRLISVFIKSLSNQIIIIVKNPVAEDIDVNNLTTTKTPVEQHGLGLISMKNLVAKYGGEVILSCEKHIFQVHMVLRNQTPE